MIITFPPPVRPWSTNDRVHWAQRAELTRLWRNAARLYARVQHSERCADKAGRPVPSYVEVTVPFTRKGRRDPHNYTGTVVKAIVDGLVDAHLWPDDTPEWVTVKEPKLVAGKEVKVVVTARRVRT